ncbi:MAG: hypothetical protein KDA78_21840, partial [Planctomycetaceae bacterium]|nr:hypothetical protein [Planctomycetaceae bacterium]
MLLAFSPSTTFADSPSPIDFNRDIRPLLSDRCFACHGPDAKSRAAGLRLDARDDAVAENGSSGVIVAGDADNSELVRRLTTDDSSERMPPEDHDEPLTDEEIKLIERWINDGAAYAVHWS